MRHHCYSRFERGLLAFASSTILASSLTAQLVVTDTPAPNRGGARDNWCPPNANGATGEKSPLDVTKGDKNAANDKRYYMGETKLVLTEGATTTDLIVRLWCVAKEPTDQGAGQVPRFLFGDFFTSEILTSKNGVETQQIPPGTPC